MIRDAAADTLSAVLILIADRDTPQKSSWYTKMLTEVQIGLGLATTESIHGSLLIIRELVLHANMVW